MSEPHLPDGEPVELYLDLLRLRLNPEEYDLLLRLVRPALRALGEDVDLADLGPDGDRPDEGPVPQEIRDEAALVIAAAVTGRLDNVLIELDYEDTGPIRVVTDAASAADPDRRREIADSLLRRRREDEELRGIAEVSDLPTDF
ncbi:MULTISPECIES: hypothetical protein [Streptomyces]|uniref:Uncharacterized protein n=1 Tax=Streptomyces chilikensis TaxID=1194079 RepID=A0ABV3ET99_9ACTN|nr:MULTISPECIES: hypothetical protein [Streptomyces]MDH6228607.1 hypothetical protein [Streptomyces sp. MJP52]